MARIDWTRYMSDQIRWAESLLAKAEDIHGYDPAALYDKSAATLDDVSRLIRQNIASREAKAGFFDGVL